MRQSFGDAVRDAWNDREIPMWIASTILHLIILFIASQQLIDTSPISKASFKAKIMEIPEPPKVEEVEPEVELPKVEEPQPEQEEIVEVSQPDSPADSVEVPNPPEQVADTFSPVDNAPLDAISSLVEGPGPMASAPKGLGGILNSRGKGRGGRGVGVGGATKETEDAVDWGLEWLVRHQLDNGSWKFNHLEGNRRRGATSGEGSAKSDMAATAMATLPFLARNYTHKEGKYQRVVTGALKWMITNQQRNGLLMENQVSGHYTFYTHGLATITICEAYALTKDPFLEQPSRKAIEFLISQQNAKGGWRYTIGDGDCDTSVLGWQVMGLKSALMANIEVPSSVFDKCKGFLETVRMGGSSREQFGYTVENGKIGAVNLQCDTAIGQLCYQYMGLVKKNDPMVQAGVDFMLASPVSMQARNAYYWYYATQVVHNVQGPKWDQWNRQMRRVLLESQNLQKDHIDHGSWDPLKPSKDAWGEQGGRHMVTCLHLLCLEIYYRYLPIFEFQEAQAAAAAEGGAAPAMPAEKPAVEESPKEEKEAETDEPVKEGNR